VKQQNYLEFRRVLMSISAVGFLTGCATEPPPLPPNNAAEPQVRSPVRTPRNLLTQDETTLAIERQLSATQVHGEAAEKMEHNMGNMPGMQHEDIKMEHDRMHYTCPMHPQVHSDKSGKCPICGMQLVKKKEGQ
jgi:Heavy metal binding domain